MTAQWENGPFNTKEEALSAAGIKPTAPTLQERLRELCKQNGLFPARDGLGLADLEFGHSASEVQKAGDAMREAADEIDRLREQNVGLVNALAWVIRTHVRDGAIIDSRYTAAINSALAAAEKGKG
jgi:hypothetical protein